MSGSNVSWVNYARDIGPGTTDLTRFDEMFSQLSEAGGNSMRFWLHITGANTPAWNGSEVVGPGEGAISDMEDILDSAWERGVGMVLCLWSFDMLRKSNGSLITGRSRDLLSNPSLTQSYIDNALIPMVDALKDHPAIIAWEIFNEPEGMSNELGWDFNEHVPMADIQRFVNLTAGAIHRTDPDALVTNGSWAFIASTDRNPVIAQRNPALPKLKAEDLDAQELNYIQQSLSKKYEHPFTIAATESFYDALHSRANFNYYTDDRLIDAGGDPDGTLDFYGVHYYEWAGTALSPFHHNYSEWGLDKPLVIGEFYLGGSSDSGGDGDPDFTLGIPWEDLYTTLIEGGYAGAWAWQWYNYPNNAEGVISWPRILESTQLMLDQYPGDVALDLGLRIVQFNAEPPAVEIGFSTELRWFVSSATSVTLNGEAVAFSGSQVISPSETTTYVLEASSSDNQVLSEEITVRVLAPNEVNRARLQLAYASTIERCCGGERTPDRAFDGEASTRWSSAWDTDEADDNPDDEWIYVDLGQAYDVERVLLNWEGAYAKAYTIDVSNDAQVWETVFEESNSDGGLDDIDLLTTASARFVRMKGVARFTRFGYSLWEFEVFGLLSALQPPEVALISPIEGALFEPGSEIPITATAFDSDGDIAQVDIFADGQSLVSLSNSPYTIGWSGLELGDYTLSATAVDDDGLTVHSRIIPVYVSDTGVLTRYEAEGSTLEGNAASTVQLGASGRFVARLEPGGRMVLDNIEVAERGEYLLKFRYRVLSETLVDNIFASHELEINGADRQTLRFTGTSNTWYQRGLKAILTAGVNSISMEATAGQLMLDFVDVSVDLLNVANEDQANGLPANFALKQNYPNPFNPTTQIDYALPKAAHVKLEILDIAGRQVIQLVDQFQIAGEHTYAFDAGRLPSGIYVYRIQTDDFVQVRQMILMK